MNQWGMDMALILDVLSRLETADISIDQNRCVRVRNRNASCRCCADACVSGCISYEDNQLVISPEKCIGCATCASVCPTDALRPKKQSDDSLHAACLACGERSGGRIVISCQDMLNAADGLYDPSRVVAVACLGRVDCSLLLRLAADGAEKITLVQGACERCENERGMRVAQRTAQTANTLLETWNSPVRVAVSQRLPGSTRASRDQGFDQSKRQFLFTVGSEAKDAAALVADTAMKDALEETQPQPRFVHVDEHGTLPHAVSERRSVLLSSLDLLEEHRGAPQDMMIDVPLWSEAVIDVETCSTCRMCATFCPTGANFKFCTKSGKVGIKHQVRKCVNCRLCQDICPTGALTLSEEVFASDIAENVVERFLMKGTEGKMTHDTMERSVGGIMKDEGVPVTLA